MAVNNISSLQAGGLGTRWKPKASRLYVGRDVGAMPESTRKEGTKGIVLGDITQRLQEAMAEQSAAKSRTKLGFRLGGLGQNEEFLGKGVGTLSPTFNPEELLNGQIKDFKNEESVSLTYINGKANLKITGREGERFVEITRDTRVGWNSDGSADISTGSGALKGGKLAAEGKNEILLRVSGVDVQAGEGSTVLNLGGAKGSFEGGSNVTYLGNYDRASIKGGTGLTELAGNFTGSSIDTSGSRTVFSGTAENTSIEASGKPGNEFSGFFSNVEIVAREHTENKFTGTFLNNSKIQSGDGNDSFTGLFIDTSIQAGNGDNSFGKKVALQDGVNADFLRCDIEAGDGNDKFVGYAALSNIRLGDGDNSVIGVLGNSSLETGDGNDKITLLYSRASIVEAGGGNDHVHLVTGTASNIKLGDGKNQMTSGLNDDDTSSSYGSLKPFTKMAWVERSNERAEYGHYFGDVENTNIDASQGENEIAVHDGQNVHKVYSGVNASEESEEPEEPLAAGEEILDAKFRTDAALRNSLQKTLRNMLERTRNGEDGALAPSLDQRMERLLEALKDMENEAESEERYFFASLDGKLAHSAGSSVSIDGGTGGLKNFDRHDRHAFERQAQDTDNVIRKALKLYKQSNALNK